MKILIYKRLRLDWELKYGHSIYLLETFVDCERFLGTCYRTSNWIYLGKTKGRSRQDRYKRLRVPIKDIFLYPLVSNFRLASWAVDLVRTQFYEWIKKELHKKEGLRTSSMLWPGNSWPIEEQAVIFKLLGSETKKIGVNLNPSMLMIPQKSLSFLLGIGKILLAAKIPCNVSFVRIDSRAKLIK